MRRGFTLIELVVVLMILALVTHLAVRELGKVQRARLGQVANAQLETLREAVWHRLPGEEPTGFLVDMGRFPHAVSMTNELGREVGTLRELWTRPEGVAPFALRPAVASNLVVATSEKNELSDATVIVPCGWRGPYVRLPFGRERLVDAWGNPMESPDDAGFARLLGPDGQSVAAGSPVTHVRHLGTDGRPDDVVEPPDEAARDRTTELAPVGGRANQLVVNASFFSGVNPSAVDGTARCRWYMPCGGAITGHVMKIELAGTTQTSFSFEGLPLGICTFVVDVGTNGVSRQGSTRGRVVLPPGGRIVDVKVAVE